jgi:uncharacterized protein (TIGR02996 family)
MPHFRVPPAEGEAGFVEALGGLTPNSIEWETARLVFADWLAERGDPREAVVRARWVRKSARKRKGSPLEFWTALLPRPWPAPALGRRWKLFGGCVNATWLLHFAPNTLKLQPPWGWRGGALEHLEFTYYPARLQDVWWYDAGAHLEGFACLFKGPPEAAQRSDDGR